MRRSLVAVAVVAVVMSVVGFAQQRGRGPQGPPDIVGNWTGTWAAIVG